MKFIAVTLKVDWQYNKAVAVITHKQCSIIFKHITTQCTVTYRHTALIRHKVSALCSQTLVSIPTTVSVT
jgi:hypothetical protein